MVIFFGQNAYEKCSAYENAYEKLYYQSSVV